MAAGSASSVPICMQQICKIEPLLPNAIALHNLVQVQPTSLTVSRAQGLRVNHSSKCHASAAFRSVLVCHIDSVNLKCQVIDNYFPAKLEHQLQAPLTPSLGGTSLSILGCSFFWNVDPKRLEVFIARKQKLDKFHLSRWPAELLFSGERLALQTCCWRQSLWQRSLWRKRTWTNYVVIFASKRPRIHGSQPSNPPMLVSF